MAKLVSFAAGLLFGIGLLVGGMTQPAKVIGFLDVFGSWDPSLMFVMGGAVTVHFVLFRLIMRRKSPWLSEAFHVPTRRDLTGRLVVGSVLFGVGWGLAGYCPGPALTSLPTLSAAPVVLVVAMVAGMWLFHAWDTRKNAPRPSTQRSSKPVLSKLAPERGPTDA